MIPIEPLLALIGGAAILMHEKGLRYVAAGYLLWIAFQGLAPVVRQYIAPYVSA